MDEHFILDKSKIKVNDLIVVSGDTGMGKSAFVQNIITHAKRDTLFLSLEMDETTGEITGAIIATSTDEMDGGEGKIVCFDAETGKYGGYGQSLECAN